MERSASLRLLLALMLSIALHLSFIYGVGVGPSKSAPTQTILARLAPEAVISASAVAARRPASAAPVGKLTSTRAVGALTSAASTAPGSEFPEANVAVPTLADSGGTPAKVPEAPFEVTPEPAPTPPARPDENSLPRADVPLIVDMAWYTAQDLDVYPRALVTVEPAYPPSAVDVSGEVLLQLMIDEFGAVNEVTVVKAEPAGYFEESALRAFKAARFSPAQRDGHAVRSHVVVKVRFAPYIQASTGR